MNREPDRELRRRIALAIWFVVLLPFAFVYAAQFAANALGIWLLELSTV